MTTSGMACGGQPCRIGFVLRTTQLFLQQLNLRLRLLCLRYTFRFDSDQSRLQIKHALIPRRQFTLQGRNLFLLWLRISTTNWVL